MWAEEGRESQQPHRPPGMPLWESRKLTKMHKGAEDSPSLMQWLQGKMWQLKAVPQQSPGKQGISHECLMQIKYSLSPTPTKVFSDDIPGFRRPFQKWSLWVELCHHLRRFIQCCFGLFPLVSSSPNQISPGTFVLSKWELIGPQKYL